MAVGDVFQFSADLKKFSKIMDIDVAKVRRRVALDVFRRVTKRSPVGNPDLWKNPPSDHYVGGRFRASWALSDSVPSSFVAAANADAYPQQGQNTAGFNGPYDAAWIVNNVPYALSLEFGHSKQAPYGMVRIALAEVAAEMEAATGAP